MSQASANTSPNRHRHPEFYIDAADLHILIDHTFFCVHSYFFLRESTFFEDKIIPTSPGDVIDGATDSEPIVLEDVTLEEFEIFLWVFYSPQYSGYDATSVDDWNCILKLANKWGFDDVKKIAERHICRIRNRSQLG